MQALAPNLTTLVGELVGARLVQHAGSIMNLAKQPAWICVEIKFKGRLLLYAVPYGTLAADGVEVPRHRRDVGCPHTMTWR